jgi:2-polyprenyl-3-methyl-5-hydroxy-6-metoxy-1,4-benzoquinol methylase
LDFEIPSYYSNSSVIVELGSNTGRVSATLAERDPHKTFVAIDPVHDAIEYGKKHYTRDNLTFIEDTAQNFNLEEHQLPLADLIFCYHVLHWIPREDLPQVFDNIATNLNDHGKIHITTSAQQSESILGKLVRQTMLYKPKWCRIFLHV